MSSSRRSAASIELALTSSGDRGAPGVRAGAPRRSPILAVTRSKSARKLLFGLRDLEPRGDLGADELPQLLEARPAL